MFGDEAKPFPTAKEPLTTAKGVAWGRPRGPGGLVVAAHPSWVRGAQETAIGTETSGELWNQLGPVLVTAPRLWRLR